MVTSRKVKGVAMPMPAGVAMGVVTSLMITMLLAVMVAGMVLSGRIAEVYLGYFTMGILLFASFFGTLISVLKIKRRWMLVGCVTGGVFYLVLLLVTAVCFGGNYQGVAVSGIMTLLGSLASGMLGARMNVGARKKYKYGTR